MVVSSPILPYAESSPREATDSGRNLGKGKFTGDSARTQCLGNLFASGASRPNCQ
jgi:hypothetical protein